MDALSAWQGKEGALRNATSSTRLWSQEQLGVHGGLIDESMSHLSELMPSLFADQDHNQWTSKEKALRTLSAWTLGRLVGARSFALDGYLVDAIILARSAFEALLLIIAFDIEEDTEPPDALLSGKWTAGGFVGQRDIRKFLVDNVSRELAALSDLYTGLSNLSHPGHIKAVLLQSDYVEDADENALRFHLAGVRKPNDLRIVMHFIWYQVLVLLGYLPLAFPSLEDRADIQAFVDDSLVESDKFLATVQRRG